MENSTVSEVMESCSKTRKMLGIVRDILVDACSLRNCRDILVDACSLSNCEGGIGRCL